MSGTATYSAETLVLYRTPLGIGETTVYRVPAINNSRILSRTFRAVIPNALFQTVVTGRRGCLSIKAFTFFQSSICRWSCRFKWSLEPQWNRGKAIVLLFSGTLPAEFLHVKDVLITRCKPCHGT